MKLFVNTTYVVIHFTVTPFSFSFVTNYDAPVACDNNHVGKQSKVNN